MPRPISDHWERLSNVKLLERYGMTEIGMALSQSLDENSRLDGAVGQPMLGVSARIRTEDDKLVLFDSETNVHGELEIKTESIFKEYWKLPEKTREEFTGTGYQMIHIIQYKTMSHIKKQIACATPTFNSIILRRWLV